MPTAASPFRRIVWLEPARLPFGWRDQNIYTGVLSPRAGPKMAGLLRSLGYEVEVISGEVSPIEPTELAAEFDLACISVLSNTTPHGLVLGRQLTELGLPVVMGGYQFAHQAHTPETLRPTEQALRFVPYIIRGEGFRALPLFLEALAGRGSLALVPGLSYRADGGIRHVPSGPPLDPAAYAALPPADWTAVRDRRKFRCLPLHGLVGCPRECSWCAVRPRDGNGQLRAAPERLVDELALALEAGDFRHLFMSTDNFPVIHTWARAVCEAMLERGLTIPWTCQGEAPAARRTELVELMARAGCERWCLGFESLNASSLEDSHKRQDRQLMEEAVRCLRDHGLHIHGMFIVGLPHDTRESILRTVDWAVRMGLESVQFLCLSDLPGSNDYERYHLGDVAFQPFEGALAPLNWIFVNGHYARLGNETMDLADVQETMILAMERFYRPLRTLATFLRPNWRTFRAHRRRGASLSRSARAAVLHSLVAGFLRWRGVTGVRQLRRQPLARLYQRLLAAPEEQFADVREQLAEHLPPSWLDLFERVHTEHETGLAPARAVSV